MEKIAVINYSNKEGWKKYRELSDEYAEKIKDIVMQNDDADIMEQKIRYTDIDLQIKSFGITWKGGSKKKKREKYKRHKRHIPRTTKRIERYDRRRNKR